MGSRGDFDQSDAEKVLVQSPRESFLLLRTLANLCGQRKSFEPTAHFSHRVSGFQTQDAASFAMLTEKCAHIEALSIGASSSLLPPPSQGTSRATLSSLTNNQTWIPGQGPEGDSRAPVARTASAPPPPGGGPASAT